MDYPPPQDAFTEQEWQRLQEVEAQIRPLRDKREAAEKWVRDIDQQFAHIAELARERYNAMTPEEVQAHLQALPREEYLAALASIQRGAGLPNEQDQENIEELKTYQAKQKAFLAETHEEYEAIWEEHERIMRAPERREALKPAQDLAHVAASSYAEVADELAALETDMAELIRRYRDLYQGKYHDAMLAEQRALDLLAKQGLSSGAGAGIRVLSKDPEVFFQQVSRQIAAPHRERAVSQVTRARVEALRNRSYEPRTPPPAPVTAPAAPQSTFLGRPCPAPAGKKLVLRGHREPPCPHCGVNHD